MSFDAKKLNKVKKKKILIPLVIVAVIVIAIMLLSVFRSHGNDNENMEEYGESPEITAVAERMDVDASISGTGEISSSIIEKKTPHVSYKLQKINVTEGQAIHEGDPILIYSNGQAMEAPYDCVVESWELPEIGKAIDDDAFVKLEGTKIMKVEIEVDEDRILDVKEGNTASVTVKATGKEYDGEVSFVSDIGKYSEGSSTFLVRVIFENDGDVRLGMNGETTIKMGMAENVIAVPKGAVFNDGDVSYVTVKKGDDTEDVEVVTGLKGDEYVEIKSGLKEGQEVIVNEDSGDDYEYEDYDYMF